MSDFGARGDGQTLDTAAIQAAVDALPSGGLLRFPPGTYRIESDKGIALKDDVRLDLGEAVIAGANVNGARCRIFKIEGRRNVVISGGTLVGSRSGSPDWGVGIYASDAQDLLIENVTLKDFYFDGILLTGNARLRARRRARRGGPEQPPHRPRRSLGPPGHGGEQHASPAATGSPPRRALNFEPNAGNQVHDVRIRKCTFAGNAGVGLYVHRAKGDVVKGATIEDSVVENNGHGIVVVSVESVSIVNNRVSGHPRPATSGVVIGDTAGATVRGNHLEGNFRGILSAGAPGSVIQGNTVVGTGPEGAAGASADANGIVCLGPSSSAQSACTVAGNTVRRCAGSGVVAQEVSLVSFKDNTIEEVGQRAVLLRGASNSRVESNKTSASGRLGPEYPAIELSQSSSDNVIAANVIRLGAGSRAAIAVCPACRRNEVSGNVVLP